MDEYRNGIRVEPPEGYNGWTNAETWHTKLCIDNEEGSYLEAREAAREALAAETELEVPFTTLDDQAAFSLADSLRDVFDEAADDYTEDAPAWLVQFVRYGIEATNWREIAESLIREVGEEDAYRAR